MINVDKIGPDNRFRFVILPNCSISWRVLVLFYLLTCVLALSIGLLFLSAGLWLILPFSGLEMLAADAFSLELLDDALDRLARLRPLAKPRLGIIIEAGDNGVRVIQVLPDSVADAAGLQTGDVISNAADLY